ncbi:site-specific integrase [Rikenella microfusus]|uniref:site-specific integrase n=1 Tax=Rikenella microfusus TaxID=28139 RepID=UPI00248E4A61|nr:site-specific integrase [Rikenella microfusus]
MERRTFKVTFFLRKARTGKNGLAPILARITTNRLVQDVYIQCAADPKRWDQTKERATGKNKYASEVNAYLDDFRARIVSIRNELLKEGYEGNAAEIKYRLQHAGKTARMFIDELSAFCEMKQKEVGVRITQLTANKFHRMLRYVKEYTAEEYGKADLPLSALNYAYFQGFQLFVQTRHNCHHNGAVNLLKTLRSFFVYCIRNEWLDKSPMKDLRLREEVTEVKAHLTKSELERMLAKRMPNERLERVRDVFAFCCLTGLAFTDADHLRSEHIGRDDSGNVWIRKPRQKTGVLSVIPLLPIARTILEKYAADPACREKGKLLPVCSNQRMNSYLAELADICGIEKKLTTHCARHTFACVALDYGMPIEIIAKILGHTKVNMTRHYARLSEGAVLREMTRLGEKLNLKPHTGIAE